MMKSVYIYNAGECVLEGIYVCLNCGQKVFIENGQHLKKCSKCGLEKFTLQKRSLKT